MTTTNTATDVAERLPRLLDELARSTPTQSEHTPFDPNVSMLLSDSRDARRPRRVAAVAAAVVVVIAGVGALAFARPDNPDTAATTTLDRVVLFDAPTNGESLLTTPLGSDQVPVVILDGATTTYAQSQRYPGPFGGGFAGATVLVPDDASFDMPRIAMDVVERTATNGNLELDLTGNGEPVEVAGTTGYLSTEQNDLETGATGPIHLLFFELGADRYVRVNATGMGVDEMVSIVDTYDPATGAVTVPDGYRELPMPDDDLNQMVEFGYDLGGGAKVGLQGSSRGAEFLLGDLGTSVTSTQVIDGVEVAVRSYLEDQTELVRAFWVQGDWAFRADISGSDIQATIADVLTGFRLVDDTTFTANFEGGEVVTDSTRAADVEAMVADVDLPQALDGLDLADRRGVNIRYQEIAAVSGTIACALLDVYFDSIQQNPAGAQEAADALAASTEWDMLLEIDDQGGWSSAVWETAAAIGGSGAAPVTTIPGGEPPSRDNLYPGLGCDTR